MKRTPITLIVVALAALGGFLAYREYRNPGEEIVPAPPQGPAAVLGAAALVLDSDGDGLKDWEEELWKTESLNPDTDGDGTSDAEEIKAGRNPLRPGPLDGLDDATKAAKVNPDAGKPTTDTERLARELFATYLSSRREGLPLSERDVDRIVSTISTSVPTTPAQTFTEKDAETFSDETPARLREYGSALGSIFKKPWPGRENEMIIFERAVKDPNEETARLDLANLTSIALAYGQLAKDIARTKVPAGALASHLRAANAASEIGESIRGMSSALDDPVRGLTAVARYLEAVPRFGESLTALRYYLQNRGVSFSESEDGYALWRVTTQ